MENGRGTLPDCHGHEQGPARTSTSTTSEDRARPARRSKGERARAISSASFGLLAGISNFFFGESMLSPHREICPSLLKPAEAVDLGKMKQKPGNTVKCVLVALSGMFV